MSVADEGELRFGLRTNWVLVTRNPKFFKSQAFSVVAEEIEIPADLSVWTDDFNNLIQVLQ
jgi:hypothetical protein